MPWFAMFRDQLKFGRFRPEPVLSFCKVLHLLDRCLIGASIFSFQLPDADVLEEDHFLEGLSARKACAASGEGASMTLRVPLMFPRSSIVRPPQ